MPTFLTQFLLKVGLMTADEYVVEREPTVWWESGLAWLGMVPYDVIQVYRVDLLRLFVSLLLVVMFMILVSNLLIMIYCALMRIIRTLCAIGSSFIGGVVSSFTCVFRLLASFEDSGQKTSKVDEIVVSQIMDAYVPESLVDGSPLLPMAMPDCQAAVGYMDGTIFRAFGCCIRIQPSVENNYIIVPTHVWEMGSDVACVGRGSATVTIDKLNIGTSNRRARASFILATDISAIEISTDEASRMGIKVARVLSRIPTGGVIASLVGATGSGSLGKITNDPASFGVVIYTGSSTGGFSGAAYMVGGFAAAIHFSGGRRNLGYSMRCALVTLQSYARVRPESSEDFLVKNIRERKKSLWIDETWGHSDECRIQLDGEYHIVTRTILSDVLGRDKELRGWVTYEADPSGVVVSGNETAAALSGGSAASTQLTQDRLSKVQALTLLQDLGYAISSPKKQKKDSGGQAKQPAAKTPSSTTQATSQNTL